MAYVTMSILQEVEQELVGYIHLWHQKGFSVSRMLIVQKMGQLRPKFGLKSLVAYKMVVSRFLVQKSLLTA